MPDEIELKLALDGTGFDRLAVDLMGRYGPGSDLAQDNRFFDSADRRLRGARMNLRLRNENGRVVLTCKRPGAGGHGSGFVHHDELESVLDLPWDDLLADPARIPLPTDWAAALAGAPIVLLGGFSNQRRQWDADGEHICLDRTTFSGPSGVRTDHELEVETHDAPATAARWRARLTTLAIPWREQPLTKFARFLAVAGVA
jgi:uncharacterized protein YjbK